MPTSRTIGRRFLRLAAGLALLAVLLVLLYALSPWLAAQWLPRLAAGHGLQIDELALSRPGPRGLTVYRLGLRNSRLHVSASDGRLEYDLGTLLQGRVTALTFRQVSVEVLAPPSDAGDAEPAQSAIATMDPSGLLDALPVARGRIESLVVAVPALDFRATGHLELAPRALTLALAAQAPPRAERFALQARAAADGQLQATLTDVRSGQRMLALTSRLTGERLAVQGEVTLEGFPLELAAAVAGVPLANGALRGSIDGSLPWPLPDNGAALWRSATATGGFQGGWRLPGAPWQVQQAAGDWSLADNVLTVAANGQVAYAGTTFHAAVSATRLDLHSGNARGELLLADQPDGDPYLSMDWSLAAPTLALDGRAALRGRLLELVALQVPLPPGRGALRTTFSMTLPWPLEGLDVSAEGALEGNWTAGADALTVQDFSGTWRVQGDRLSGQGSGRMSYRGRAADVGITLQALHPQPLHAAGEVRLGALAPVRVSLERTRDEALALGVEGLLQVRDSLAGAALDGWDQQFDLTSGSIALQAALEMASSGAVTGRVEVDLEQVSGYYGEYAVSGLGTALQLRGTATGWSLAPTPLQAARLATGVDLENVRTGVALSEGVAVLQATTADLLGGAMRVAPFSYHLEPGTGETVVTLQNLDLARILALEGDHVAGTGTIDGTLPVRFEEGAASVAGGTVHAAEPGGVLRVSPALAGGTGQPGLDFALRALQDFRYQVLTADVDYSVAGDLDLAVHLEGSNPAIESGRPIHYNVNVSENVPTLLRALRLQDEVTRGIERRMNN